MLLAARGQDATPPAAAPGAAPDVAKPTADATPPAEATTEAAGDPAQPAAADLALLSKAAEQFVDAFNAADATAMSALFTEQAQITSDEEENIQGRAAIEEYYKDIFSRDDRPLAALEAQDVHAIAPGVILERGVIHLTNKSNKAIRSHRYQTVHVRQPDGKWLIANVHDQGADIAPAPDKLRALEWMVGDWTLQRDEMTLSLHFHWDEGASFLIGDISAAAIGAGKATHITYRIGWNPQTEKFVSWSFDSRGGYSTARWSATGKNEWLLHSDGVTSAGEIVRSTQKIIRNENGEGYHWIVRDHVIGDNAQPDLDLSVVKQPPPTSSEANAIKPPSATDNK